MGKVTVVSTEMWAFALLMWASPCGLLSYGLLSGYPARNSLTDVTILRHIRQRPHTGGEYVTNYTIQKLVLNKVLQKIVKISHQLAKSCQQESLANGKVSARQPWCIRRNSLNRSPLKIAQLKSAFSAQQSLC